MNKIPVVLCSDNNIFFVLGTVLSSLSVNANKDTFYDVNILCAGDVIAENKDKIKQMEDKFSNLSITLFDMKDKFKNLPKTHTYVNYVSAYKMLIPSVLHNYDKVLYLDTDVLVRDDLWDLYNSDFEDNYLLGVRDIYCQLELRNSIQKEIKLPDMDYYVNAGVMLLNLKLIRQDKIDTKWISLLGSFKGSVDQHIINHVCYGRIGFLDLKYNVCLSDLDCYTNDIGNIFASRKTALEAANNPSIFHYTGKNKPWKYYNIPFAHEWFRYYIKSTFKDIMVKRIDVATPTPAPASTPAPTLTPVPTPNRIITIKILGIPVLKQVITDIYNKYYFLGIRIYSKKTIEEI